MSRERERPMKNRTALWIIVLGLACAATPVQSAAQAPEQEDAYALLSPIEVGVFGDYKRFGEYAGCVCTQPTNDAGVGVRAGTFLRPGLLLEADLATTRSDHAIDPGSVRHTLLGVRVTHRRGLLPLGDRAVEGQVGVGPTRVWQDERNQWAWTGLAGFQVTVFDPVRLRLDGLVHYLTGDETTNLAVQLGAGVRLR